MDPALDGRPSLDVLCALRPRIAAQIARARVPEDDREDLRQDVLLAAAKQLSRDRFRHDAQLGTWIFKITKTTILDYWRRRYRHAADPLDPRWAADSDYGSPWHVQEPHLLLDEILRQRSPHHRTIFLRLARGERAADVATALGLSTRTVQAIRAEIHHALTSALSDRPTDRPTRRPTRPRRSAA